MSVSCNFCGKNFKSDMLSYEFPNTKTFESYRILSKDTVHVVCLLVRAIIFQTEDNWNPGGGGCVVRCLTHLHFGRFNEFVILHEEEKGSSSHWAQYQENMT